MSTDEERGLTPNIGNKERIASVITGSYLLYKALTNDKKSFTGAITGGYMVFRGATGFCPFNSAIGIKEVETQNDITLKTNLIVNKPRSQVYNFWRKLENLPKIMNHLERVNSLDEKTSEWKAKIPGGIGNINWKSEITEDIENEFISWKSLPNSTVENIGSVRFKDAGEYETEVQVDITYRVPLGTPGKRVAKLLNPVFEGMVREDVRNFRRILETGETPVLDGNPS